MKIFTYTAILSLIYCKPYKDTAVFYNNIKNEYSSKLSPDRRFILFYKYEANPHNPQRWLSYFVTESKTNILKKEKSRSLTDSIYWRSDNTLVLIPYREVIRAKTEVNEENEEDQILIPIK
ncbi:hypothetical protein [Chryseobacterium sp. JM1]|uniref:hypothetical protein n=1 Tax=Chryseobacterium sp. JM1 TaxID=1233950 RepID=UPI0004E734A3|nr:hypothetical protein [Chryseobacterium sp. JM1]KFF22013.1 hypothetical protein IW22_08870 [Chryseobacterium sp. JM1]